MQAMQHKLRVGLSIPPAKQRKRTLHPAWQNAILEYEVLQISLDLTTLDNDSLTIG